MSKIQNLLLLYIAYVLIMASTASSIQKYKKTYYCTQPPLAFAKTKYSFIFETSQLPFTKAFDHKFDQSGLISLLPIRAQKFKNCAIPATIILTSDTRLILKCMSAEKCLKSLLTISIYFLIYQLSVQMSAKRGPYVSLMQKHLR